MTTSLRSFRLRLLVGSVLWAGGLLAIGHILFIALAHRHPIVLRVHRETLWGIALLLLLTGLWQVRVGLSSFDRLRARLAAVREGREPRIEGNYPTEVQPLVNDLNSLLEHQEQTVKRALAKAGDLAHGLKTPLAVLTQEAERAEVDGHHELASTMNHQLDRMRRQVEYHLAQARAAASGATPGARCSVLASAEGLSRTLQRLHAGRALDIEIRVPADHSVRCQREDLDEMLGNLLDNACKWTGSRVMVESKLNPEGVFITVDDDGPGLDPSMRETVLQRGVRADEAAPGSGFGLAIVRDLAELYGGSISLSAAPGGGLRATLHLPG